MGVVLKRLLSRLGYEPRRAAEPVGVLQLRRMAERLNEKASRFRTVSARAVLLEQRLDQLETDLKAWDRRASAVRHQPELHADAQRICGRIEGKLHEARAELAEKHADEAHLRSLLTEQREVFATLLEHARALGWDVSGCLLYVDLTRPERVPDEELLGDDEGDFVGRVIDAGGLH